MFRKLKIFKKRIFKFFGLLDISGFKFRWFTRRIEVLPSPDANETVDELFKKKLGHSDEKCQSIESVYKSPSLRREDYFSTLKHSFPNCEEIIKKQAIVARKTANMKEFAMFYEKN